LGDTARHAFIRCYAATAGEAAFVIYPGPNSHKMLDIDCHCEAKGLQNAFVFTGSSAYPTIRGFSYKDHRTFASSTIFRCHGSIKRVALQNAHIEIALYTD